MAEGPPGGIPTLKHFVDVDGGCEALPGGLGEEEATCAVVLLSEK